MKPKTIRIVFIVLATTLLFYGCARRDAAASESGAAGADQDRTLVRTVEVDRSDFVEYGSYFGEARALSEARIVTTAGGTVEALHARPGDRVVKGQSLGLIEAQRAVIAYETAVLAEKLAGDAVEREQRFLDQGVSTQQRVDQTRLEWLNRRSALIEANLVRDGALAISPMDGIVTARHVNVFDEIAPGTAVYGVADLSRMRINVGVPEADIAGVQQLGTAVVRFSSYPGRTWTGEAVSFARARSARGLTFDVEIEIDNRDGALLSGQTAQVTLALRTLSNVVVIPTRAVAIRGDEFSVFTVEDGYARRRPIRLGPADRTRSVVIEGLSGTETIVLEGMNRLTDGVPVAVTE